MTSQPGRRKKTAAVDDMNGNKDPHGQGLPISGLETFRELSDAGSNFADNDRMAFSSEYASMLSNMHLSSPEPEKKSNAAASSALDMHTTFIDPFASYPALSSVGEDVSVHKTTMTANPLSLSLESDSKDTTMTTDLNSEYPIGLESFDFATNSANMAPEEQPIVPQATQPLCGSGALPTSLPCSKGGACSREAYDILVKCKSRISTSGAKEFDASGSLITLNFNQALRSNRETRQKLESLFNCPCAREPHMALVHASVLSMLLSSYTQAALATRSCGDSSMDLGSENAFDAILPNLLRSNSTTGANSPIAGNPWQSVPSRKDSVMSTSPTMGEFPQVKNVDAPSLDQQVENALRMQLVLGELRRTGCFIDNLEAQTFNPNADFSLGGVDVMHQSVTLWLRREHLKVTDIVRSRLKETEY